MRTADDPAAPPWTRWALAYLAAADLFVGLWAVAAPSSWFASFPGGGRSWVSALPPYNEHLSVDAGAGFLAVGVVLALAAVSGARRTAQIAAAGALVHGLPHSVFHVLNRADGQPAFDAFTSAASLVFGCIVAAAVLAAASRSDEDRAVRGEAAPTG